MSAVGAAPYPRAQSLFPNPRVPQVSPLNLGLGLLIPPFLFCLLLSPSCLSTRHSERSLRSEESLFLFCLLLSPFPPSQSPRQTRLRFPPRHSERSEKSLLPPPA